MRRAATATLTAAAVLVLPSVGGCARAPAPPSPEQRYAIELPSQPLKTPPGFVEREVVDREGNAWRFRGFVPAERCANGMASKLESFAKHWRNGSIAALSDQTRIGGANGYHDVLVACAEHRRAWVWSTEWIAIPARDAAQEFTSISMPDFDGDGCIDLVIQQGATRIALCSSTGRLIEQRE